MPEPALAREQRSAVTRWFAYAAAALALTAVVGAYGICWMVSTQQQDHTAYVPLNHPAGANRGFADVDPAATGSLSPSSPPKER